MPFDDDDDAVPRFADKDAALEFWTERAQRLKATLRETESTLKEFEESSKELEREMESELNAANGKARELQIRYEQAKGDADEWKSKYQKSLNEHSKALTDVHRELASLRSLRDTYKVQVRDMEVDNDQLQTAERMVVSSLKDLEGRYNQAIERAALLEDEVLQKNRLEEENQRLKDELQELREDLAVWQDRYSGTRANGQKDEGVVDGLRRSMAAMRSSSPTKDSLVRPPSSASTVSSSAYSSSNPALRRLSHRATLGTSHARRDSADIRHGGATKSGTTSSSNTKLRQSLGPGSMRTSPSAAHGLSAGASSHRLSSRTANAYNSPTATRSNQRLDRGQQGASMRKMAGLLENLRELQATVYSATRVQSLDGHASAIPRPSSRLSSSMTAGYLSTSTPRRSFDIGNCTPSHIPLPTPRPSSTAISSTAAHRDRPSSRMRMYASTTGADAHHRIPSSVRSQTPNLEQFSSLGFLDQDPASKTGSGVGGAHRADAGHGLVLRRSTITANHVPLRESVHPRTGKPAAPPSAMLRQAQRARHRSSSFGSNVG